MYKKKVFEDNIFTTVITELKNRTRIEQTDKITGIHHKVILTPEIRWYKGVTYMSELNSFEIFIPENEFGIKEGDYSLNSFVNLLRDLKTSPDAIQFLADMLEG